MIKNIKNLWQRYKSFFLSVIISLGVGILSTLLTMKNMNIAESVLQPPLAPPAFLFSIVWTVLYVLMGISAALVFEKRKQMPVSVRQGLTYYAMSLVVNFTWNIIFFNFRAFLIASLWIVLLLFLIIKTVLHYFKVDKPAAYLQLPYIVWVAFATYLTFGILYLNG
jgi:tryptophan-rich sensory protein